MNGNVTQFFEQRAIHLAILHLTRREDLIVTQPRRDYGLDILVEIGHGKRATGRMFGVQIKAQQALPISSHDQGTASHVTIDMQPSTVLQDLPFPLCWFVFQMHDDGGYYRWLNEPSIQHGDEPLLRVNHDNTFAPLTSDAIDRIVEQVTLWYEKRHVPEQEAVFA
jgi:hypothetical protein